MDLSQPPPSALERIALLDNEAAIVTIGSVKGLGRWTAEIYLLLFATA